MAARTRLPGWAPPALAGTCYLASAAACCVLAARRHDGFGDLFIYRSAGRAVLGGAPLYQLRFAWQLRFTYPPFAAVAFVPLAWLPWRVVPALVMAANVAVLPLTLWLALRLPPARSRLARTAPSPAGRQAAGLAVGGQGEGLTAGGQGEGLTAGGQGPDVTALAARKARRVARRGTGRLAAPERLTAVTLSLAAASAATWLEPVRTNLAYGQVNLLVTVLILADLALPDRSRFKGAASGVAAGLKLTPAIFAVYFLLTRRYRAAAASAAAAGLTVALAAVILPGDSAAFWGGAFADPARIGRIENAANQSLRGALSRLLHTVNVQSPWLIVAAVVAAAGLATAAVAGRRGNEASGFCRCAITGLLISPVSWSHHWVIAVPALLVAGAGAWRNRSMPALAALAAAAGAGWTAVIWHVPIGARSHAELHLNLPQLWAADAYVLAGLVVIAVAAGQELARARARAAEFPAVAPELAGRAAGRT